MLSECRTEKRLLLKHSEWCPETVSHNFDRYVNVNYTYVTRIHKSSEIKKKIKSDCHSCEAVYLLTKLNKPTRAYY